MKFYDGKDLYNKLQNRNDMLKDRKEEPMPPLERLNIALGIAKKLRWLHENKKMMHCFRNCKLASIDTLPNMKDYVVLYIWQLGRKSKLVD